MTFWLCNSLLSHVLFLSMMHSIHLSRIWIENYWRYCDCLSRSTKNSIVEKRSGECGINYGFMLIFQYCGYLNIIQTHAKRTGRNIIIGNGSNRILKVFRWIGRIIWFSVYGNVKTDPNANNDWSFPPKFLSIIFDWFFKHQCWWELVYRNFSSFRK